MLTKTMSMINLRSASVSMVHQTNGRPGGGPNYDWCAQVYQRAAKRRQGTQRT